MNSKGWGHCYEDVVRGGTAQLHILITACQADFNPDRSNKVFALQSYNRNPKKFSPDVSGTTLSTSLHVKGELHFCYLDLTIIHICMQICPPFFLRFFLVCLPSESESVRQFTIFHIPYPICHFPSAEIAFLLIAVAQGRPLWGTGTVGHVQQFYAR